jgi:transcriptional regulator with XRE-family HTH domain
MQRARRIALAGEAERRVNATFARLGGEVVSMRARRSWTQQELAHRAGIGRCVISRFEHGHGPIDVETLERIGLACGAPLRIEFAPEPRAEVADAGHLAIQELVLGLGRRNGYDGRFELGTKPAEPWRSIDVVLAYEARHRMICVECWNTICDIGSAMRVSARKAAELEQMAVGRWGEDARVGLVWVVRATARNRSLVARYPEVFASRFRGSSQLWVAALTEEGDAPGEPGLVWSDLAATRVFAWRRATTTST